MAYENQKYEYVFDEDSELALRYCFEEERLELVVKPSDDKVERNEEFKRKNSGAMLFHIKDGYEVLNSTDMPREVWDNEEEREKFANKWSEEISVMSDMLEYIKSNI